MPLYSRNELPSSPLTGRTGIYGRPGGTPITPPEAKKPDIGGLVTPGISITPGGELTRSSGLQQTLAQLSGAYGTQAQQIAQQRGLVTPGFGALTETAVQALRNRRRQAIGNLRENLARRRVLGSSFAQDAIARAEKDFAQQEAEIRAKTTLQELDMQNRLIQQESQARVGQFNTLLQQTNFEAQLGAQVTAGINTLIQQANQFQQKMAAEEAAGRGQLFGTVGTALGYAYGGPVGGAIGGAIGGLLA